MGSFFEFILSDIGVGIAWLCTVGSAVYSFITRKKNKSLILEIQNLQNIVSSDGGHDSVTQIGEKSIYTKNNSGGMDIKM